MRNMTGVRRRPWPCTHPECAGNRFCHRNPRRRIVRWLRALADFIEPKTLDRWAACTCPRLDLGPSNAEYWTDPAKYHSNPDCPNLAWALGVGR